MVLVVLPLSFLFECYFEARDWFFRTFQVRHCVAEGRIHLPGPTDGLIPDAESKHISQVAPKLHDLRVRKVQDQVRHRLAFD